MWEYIVWEYILWEIFADPSSHITTRVTHTCKTYHEPRGARVERDGARARAEGSLLSVWQPRLSRVAVTPTRR